MRAILDLISADVSQRDDVFRMVRELLQMFGHVGLLMNSRGPGKPRQMNAQLSPLA